MGDCNVCVCVCVYWFGRLLKGEWGGFTNIYRVRAPPKFVSLSYPPREKIADPPTIGCNYYINYVKIRTGNDFDKIGVIITPSTSSCRDPRAKLCSVEWLPEHISVIKTGNICIESQTCAYLLSSDLSIKSTAFMSTLSTEKDKLLVG